MTEMSEVEVEVGGLVLYEGVTTSAGNGGGTTLVCSALGQANDYWNDMLVVIMSGTSEGQSRDILDFASGGTITVHTAFSAQIASGVNFNILSYKPQTAEVAAVKTVVDEIAADLGDATGASDTVYAQVRHINKFPIDGTTTPVTNTLADTLHKSGSYTFDNTTDSLEAISDKITTLESAISPDLGGLAFYGVVTTATDTTNFVASALADKGADVFIDRYYCQFVQADNAAPEGETRKVSAYNTSTGAFTVGVAFSVAPDVGDQFLILHESIATLMGFGDADMDFVVDDSVIAHILAVDGDVSAYDDNTMSLEALNTDLDTIITATSATVAGASQIATTTIDLEQAAASYDLFTGTSQSVVLESLSIRLPDVDCSNDATITSISIQNDDVTPQVYITAVEGVKANLTNETQLSWEGSSLIKTGTKIQLTIAGGAADAATVCDVTAKCRAVVAGGNLV